MADPSLELQESGWEELRREARKIEGDLDVKLSSYAKLGARYSQAGRGLTFLLPDLPLLHTLSLISRCSVSFEHAFIFFKLNSVNTCQIDF